MNLTEQQTARVLNLALNLAAEHARNGDPTGERDNAGAHDQGTWMSPGPEFWDRLGVLPSGAAPIEAAMPGGHFCDSTFCAAGWVVLAEPGTVLTRPDYEGAEPGVLDEDGDLTDIDAHARRLLGISHSEASLLFDGDVKAAHQLAMLATILDGRSPDCDMTCEYAHREGVACWNGHVTPADRDQATAWLKAASAAAHAETAPRS